MPYKSKNPTFTPEKQGARIRRLIPELTGQRVTGRVIGQLLGIITQSANRKLGDLRSFSKQEIESLANHFGVDFDDLWVPHLDDPNYEKRFTLKQIIKNDALLQHFCGIDLDSIARDQIVKALMKLQEFIDSSRQHIGARRRAEAERERKILVTKYIFAVFHRDYGIQASQLLDIKKRLGTYGPYQDKFNKMWENLYPDHTKTAYMKRWLKDNDGRSKRKYRQ